jgi:hypothetical protein
LDDLGLNLGEIMYVVQRAAVAIGMLWQSMVYSCKSSKAAVAVHHLCNYSKSYVLCAELAASAVSARWQLPSCNLTAPSAVNRTFVIAVPGSFFLAF